MLKIVMSEVLPLVHLASLSIFVGAENDAQNINDLPDAEATKCKELHNAGDDAPRVETMDATNAEDEKQKRKHECNCAGTRGCCGGWCHVCSLSDVRFFVNL